MHSELGRDFPKQWPLASEFSEFEYSPEIRQFWRIRVLAKMAFFGNLSDLPDSNSPKCDPSWYSPNLNLPKYGEFGEFGEFTENKVDHLKHTK
jgi:hypothetical protein